MIHDRDELSDQGISIAMDRQVSAMSELFLEAIQLGRHQMIPLLINASLGMCPVSVLADSIVYVVSNPDGRLDSDQQTQVFQMLATGLIEMQHLSTKNNRKKERVIAKALLASEDPQYWDFLGDHVILNQYFSMYFIPDCSLPVIRALHERNQITHRWWTQVFVHVAKHPNRLQRMRDLLEIRLDSSDQYSGLNRVLVGDLIEAYIREPGRRFAKALSTELTVNDRVELIEALLTTTYPEAIEDHQERLVRLILTNPHPVNGDTYDWYPANLGEWLSQTDLVDHILAIQFIPYLRMPEPITSAWLGKISAGKQMQYVWEDDCWIIISQTPLAIRRLEGWTTFRHCGWYFYSRDLVLDLQTGKFMATTVDVLILPSSSDLCELEMPDDPQTIEIEYGRKYDQLVTIPMPVILLDWYQNCHAAPKSARK